MNETEFIAGAITLVGLIAYVVKPQRWFKRNKNKTPKYAAYGLVIPWQDPYQGFNCPKCNAVWLFKMNDGNAPKYCECEELPVGHFHLECCGKIGQKDKIGCTAKFIMPSKDNA